MEPQNYTVTEGVGTLYYQPVLTVALLRVRSSHPNHAAIYFMSVCLFATANHLCQQKYSPGN